MYEYYKEAMPTLVMVHMRVFSIVRIQRNGGGWYTIIWFPAPIIVCCKTCKWHSVTVLKIIIRVFSYPFILLL